MKVRVLFFAQAREKSGQGQIEVDLPERSSVRDLLSRLERDHPGLGELKSHLAVAVNRRLAGPDEPIPDGAEVALLPPVSGG